MENKRSLLCIIIMKGVEAQLVGLALVLARGMGNVAWHPGKVGFLNWAL
jgi:hypothetical protein